MLHLIPQANLANLMITKLERAFAAIWRAPEEGRKEAATR